MFQPKRRNYQFRDIPRYWFNHDPFLTNFIASLSILFPEGELFFVDSVKAFKYQYPKELQQRITTFVGQELTHGMEHVELNERIAQRGYPVEHLERLVLGLLNLGRTILSRRQQLAVTVALEHFTAILGKQVLENEEITNGLHPIMRKLLVWHSTEEIDHKSVCFDAYMQLNPSYTQRTTTMVIASTILFAVMVYAQIIMSIADGSILRPKMMIRGIKKLFGKKGYITNIIPEYMLYFKKDFHPDNIQDKHLMDHWRQYI